MSKQSYYSIGTKMVVEDSTFFVTKNRKHVQKLEYVKARFMNSLNFLQLILTVYLSLY